MSEPEAKVGKHLDIEFQFENSLNIRLTSCRLSFEGPGLTRAESRDVIDLEPGQSVSVSVQVVPKFAGEHSLVVSFVSKQFTQITGSTKIVVTK